MLPYKNNPAFIWSLAFLMLSGIMNLFSCSGEKCKGVNCLNYGNCSSGNCNCPSGYTGKWCEQFTMVGSWKGSNLCAPEQPGAASSILTISAVTGSDTLVMVNNVGDYGADFYGRISADGKTIVFTNQLVGVSGAPDTLNGSLALISDSLVSVSYTFSNGSSYTCSGNFSRN